MATFTLSRTDYAGFQKTVGEVMRRQGRLGTCLLLLQVSVWFFVGLAGASLMQLYQRTPELQFRLGWLAILLGLALVALALQPGLCARLVRPHLLSDRG